MGKDEDSQRLIDDPQFSEAEETYKCLEEALTKVLSARETTIRNLKKLKEEVEKSYDLSRKSLIGGTAGQHSFINIKCKYV
jgi:acyl-coenzyme A synthetase/AMP-(fatty) acid ligase